MDKINKRYLNKVWNQLDKSTNHLYEAFEQLREIGLTENNEIMNLVERIDISLITELKNKIELMKEKL